MKHALLALPLLLAACAGPVPPQDQRDSWRLVSLDGTAPQMTITYTPDGAGFSGQGPCNRYFSNGAVQTSFPPRLAIGATRKACPALAYETQFLNALAMAVEEDISPNRLVRHGGQHWLEFEPNR